MDYGARMYDGQIGRWMGVDPQADFMRPWSPYCYAFNDPFNFIDNHGEVPEKPDPPTIQQIKTNVLSTYKYWSKAVNIASKVTIAAQVTAKSIASQRRGEAETVQKEIWKLEAAREKNISDFESKHYAALGLEPREFQGANYGGGGGSGSWGEPGKSEFDKVQEKQVRDGFDKLAGTSGVSKIIIDGFANERDNLLKEAEKWDEYSDAIGGVREILGNLTIKGIAEGQARDFVLGVVSSVRDSYDKSNKDSFDIKKETIKAVINQLKKTLDQVNPF